MAQGMQALKSRIRSINATKKITSAMELIANAKLAKVRNRMEQNREYATVLKETVQDILAHSDMVENKFLVKNNSPKTLTILFTSDLGLCGGYNSNMQRYAVNNLNPSDPMILMGTKGVGWLRNKGFNIINEVGPSDPLTINDLNKIADLAIDMYLKKEVSRVQILYTHFINTVSFEPALNVLLPFDAEAKKKERSSKVAMIYEPSANVILNDLVPMMVRSLVYSTWLETKTAESGSRRMAMENATDNAEELNDTLVLQYNQARQASITSEITEIVAGADAL